MAIFEFLWHPAVCCMAWLAQELFAFEADNNSRRFRIVTDTVAAENGFTASDLLEQLAIFNVLCQRHTANRDTLHLCSGWTTGPHTVLNWRGMSGGVPTLGALEAAILLLHSLQALLAHAVQTAQEVGLCQLTSAVHTEEGGLSRTTLISLPVRLGAPLWSKWIRWTTARCHCS